MPEINFKKTYPLHESYESVKETATSFLNKYLEYPNLFVFNDTDKSLTFSSERIIPKETSKRCRVMLLLSNPHPHSIYQGMFLSPNTKGNENLFWPTMRDSGWLSFAQGKIIPKQLADLCLNAEYDGPFDLIFYCYYAFPTDFPDHISKIFGKEYFKEIIEPEAKDEFNNTIRDASVEAVVTFNKGIFNLVSNGKIDRYIERLKEGEMVKRRVKNTGINIPIYLTFPTGWRYHKQYRQLRRENLELIKADIIDK